MDRSEGGYNPKLAFEAAHHRGSQGRLAARRIQAERSKACGRCSGATRNEQGVSPFGLTPCLFGGARRDRTVDLYNAIVALSQLSYGPENRAGGREV